MEIKQKKLDYDLLDKDTKEILLNKINNHLLLDDKPSEYLTVS